MHLNLRRGMLIAVLAETLGCSAAGSPEDLPSNVSPQGGQSAAPSGGTSAGSDTVVYSGAGGTAGTLDLGTVNMGGASATAGAGPCGPNFTATIRDFRSSHPDFEKFNTQGEKGIVQPELGADHKPVYALAGAATISTTGKANFDQWFRDVAGVNDSTLFELTFVKGDDGISTFQDDTFFPIDGMLFGNETWPHNFHFTLELHTEFAYKGGEVFRFFGDDDLWTFINGKLALDLGGVHSAQFGEVKLDELAASLGLVRGQTYPLDVFQAERKTDQSQFRVDSSIQFTNCDPIVF